jgi:ATP/maltotriose-dependent transcriptional regulator MalT
VAVDRSIERGRAAFDRMEWTEACAAFGSCSELGVDDLERLAGASYLLGADDESASAWERAHLAAVDAGDASRAAHIACWLGITYMLKSEGARAGGWYARAERLLADVDALGSAQGLLLVPAFLAALGSGDHDTAWSFSEQMLAIGHECADKDIITLGLLSRGEVLIATGDPAGAMKFLDEAMVSVTTGETSHIASGIVYCAVIDACVSAFDLRRAAEWTDALTEWCATQPDRVPFRGICLVHRAQVLQARGRWTEAMSEAAGARVRLAEAAHPALGLAWYQQAELHRLRGEHDDAERAYRAAGEHGHEPAPGLALLRLAEGDVRAARAAIERMLAERRDVLGRAMLLSAAVEILLAAGDLDAAHDAADELAGIAEQTDVPLLRATAAAAEGSVALAAGDTAAALRALRAACDLWRDLVLPYEVALTRVEIARACRLLGDDDAAAIEVDLARAVFTGLGAQPAVARVDALGGEAGLARPPDPLTEREHEVLRLVASGKTNREIASELVISEHTVARHLQNMFTKLGISSRTAAAAYAFERGLA